MHRGQQYRQPTRARSYGEATTRTDQEGGRAFARGRIMHTHYRPHSSCREGAKPAGGRSALPVGRGAEHATETADSRSRVHAHPNHQSDEPIPVGANGAATKVATSAEPFIRIAPLLRPVMPPHDEWVCGRQASGSSYAGRSARDQPTPPSLHWSSGASPLVASPDQLVHGLRLAGQRSERGDRVAEHGRYLAAAGQGTPSGRPEVSTLSSSWAERRIADRDSLTAMFGVLLMREGSGGV
jgi:hypothetical protein